MKYLLVITMNRLYWKGSFEIFSPKSMLSKSFKAFIWFIFFVSYDMHHMKWSISYHWFEYPWLIYPVTFSTSYWPTSLGITKSNDSKKSLSCWHGNHAIIKPWTMSRGPWLKYYWTMSRRTFSLLELNYWSVQYWFLRGFFSLEVLNSSDLSKCIKMIFFVSQLGALK